MHERFSYPKNPCSGKDFEHECDLPKGHHARHLCGICGALFSSIVIDPPVFEASQVMIMDVHPNQHSDNYVYFELSSDGERTDGYYMTAENYSDIGKPKQISVQVTAIKKED